MRIESLLQAKQLLIFNEIQGILNQFWIVCKLALNVFFDTIFLWNIQRASKEINLYTNAWMFTICEVRDLYRSVMCGP